MRTWNCGTSIVTTSPKTKINFAKTFHHFIEGILKETKYSNNSKIEIDPQ